MKRLGIILYSIVAVFHFYWMLVFQKNTPQRTKYIYDNDFKYLRSALILMVIAIPLSITLATLYSGGFMFIELILGFQVPIVLVLVHTNQQKYWNERREQRQQEDAEREEARAKSRRRRETEYERMEREMYEELERMKREFEEMMRASAEARERARQSARRDWEREQAQHRQRQGQQQRQHRYTPPPQQQARPTGMAAYLRVLGLPETCRDMKQIKAAYRTLAKKYHPDINKAANATEKFKQVKAAYDALEAMLA